MDLDVFSWAQFFNSEKEKSMPWKKSNTLLEKPVRRFKVCHDWRIVTPWNNLMDLKHQSVLCFCWRWAFAVSLHAEYYRPCAFWSVAGIIMWNKTELLIWRWNRWHKIMCNVCPAEGRWDVTEMINLIYWTLFKQWFNTLTQDEMRSVMTLLWTSHLVVQKRHSVFYDHWRTESSSSPNSTWS